MAGRVIQGFFTDGGRLSRAVSDRTSAVAQRVAVPARAVHTPGPPAAAFAGRAGAIQQRGAPGRPPLAHGGVASPVQRFGGDGSFAIDPVQVGLARSGGIPLPKPVLAKMEAAFGADFSAVRVHIGPQASRIGAIAFTTGNDLYFAPGQFQPDNVKGQQLIGHELAHVIQQRQGRVRAPGNGVTVVQDRMLEAEADRLGMRAAMQRAPVQAKIAVATRPGSPATVAAKPLQRSSRNVETPSGSLSRKTTMAPPPTVAGPRARPVQAKLEVRRDSALNAFQIYGRPDFTTTLKKEAFDEADSDGEKYIVKFSDNQGVSFQFPTIHRRHKLAWSVWRAAVNEVLAYGDHTHMANLMSKCFVSPGYKTWTKKEYDLAWKKGNYLKDMANDFFNHRDNIWLGPGDENMGKGGGLDKLINKYISNPNKTNRKSLKTAGYDPHDKTGFKFVAPTNTDNGYWNYASRPPSPRSQQMDQAMDSMLDFLGKPRN